MTKKIVVKKNSNITLSNTKDTKLSIQFNLDGFSFCITNKISTKDMYFAIYTFHETQ